MKPLQLLMDNIVWGGKNLSYNLKFIPDDKLDWKPAPEAKSALEIAAEVAGVVHGFHTFLASGNFPMEPIKFESREAAQQAVEEATAKYAEYMGTLGPDDLGGEVELPFGIMPKMQVLAMPVVETIHHHGQITYIQTLLGDKDSHFFQLNN